MEPRCSPAELQFLELDPGICILNVLLRRFLGSLILDPVLRTKSRFSPGTCQVLSGASFSLLTCKLELNSCWEIVGFWNEVLHVKQSVPWDTWKV